MIQEDFVDPSNPHLKQYTYYILNDLISKNYQPPHTININLPPTNPNHNLPRYYHDNTCDRLYLLKWTNQHDKILLEIVEIQPQQIQCHVKYKVYFDYSPEHIAIVYGYMYFIGGGQCFVVKMDQQQQPIIQRISYSQVECVCGLIEDGESSLLLYCRDSKNNLFSEEISPYKSGRNGWFSKLNVNIKTIFFQQSSDYKDFIVLVPKVMGIVLHNDHAFSLINLNTFDIIPNTYRQLTAWSISNSKSVIIRIKDLLQNNADDSIMFCIGNSMYLQFFKLDVYLKPNVQIHTNNNKYRIRQFPNESLIDFSQLSLTSQFTLNHHFQILNDLEFLKTGFVLCGFKTIYSAISTYDYYPLDQYNIDAYSIITHEIPIWKDYLTLNKNISKQSLLDALLMPNRMSPQFIKHTLALSHLNQLKPQKLNWKKIVFSWHQHFKFVKMMIFKGQLFLLRQHSVSVILPITHLHYNTQLTQLNQFETIADHYSHSQFDENMSDSLQSMTIEEVTHHHYVNDPDKKKRQFEQLVKQLYGFIQKTNMINNQGIQSFSYILPQPSMSIFPNSIHQLLINRIKDMLLFYTQSIHQMIKDLQSEQQYKLDPIITQSISPAIQLYQHLLTKQLGQQYNSYDTDIITKFIKESMANRIINNLEEDAQYGIGLLFNGLVAQPKNLQHNIRNLPYLETNLQNNAFIQMLIRHYNDGYLSITTKTIQLLFSISNINQYIILSNSIIAVLPIMQPSFITKIYIRYLLTRQYQNVIPQMKVDKKEANDILYRTLVICKPQLIHNNISDANIISLTAVSNHKQFLSILKKSITNIDIPTFQQLCEAPTDRVDSQIEHTIKKLKFAQECHLKLLEFEGIIFKFRCYVLEDALKKPTDKDHILKLIQKANAALVSYIVYYQRSYNVGDNFNEEILFGSEYLLGNITVLGRWATKIWIQLLQTFIAKREYIQREYFQDHQSLDKQLSYSLVVKSIRDNDTNLFKNLIYIYGSFYISQIIQSNQATIKSYTNMENNELKAMLSYSKINLRYQQTTQILPQMQYRNAFIQANFAVNMNK